MTSDRGWSTEDERLYREQVSKHQKMRVYFTEDGYTFFEQADGTFTDTIAPEDADLTYASVDELFASVGVQLATEDEVSGNVIWNEALQKWEEADQ